MPVRVDPRPCPLAKPPMRWLWKAEAHKHWRLGGPLARTGSVDVDHVAAPRSAGRRRRPRIERAPHFGLSIGAPLGLAPSIARLAPVSKCLAPNNKSRTGSKATKPRTTFDCKAQGLLSDDDFAQALRIGVSPVHAGRHPVGARCAVP